MKTAFLVLWSLIALGASSARAGDLPAAFSEARSAVKTSAARIRASQEKARQSRAEGCGRLLGLLPRIAELRTQIQTAGLRESARRPRLLVSAPHWRKGCDFTGPGGECFAATLTYSAASAYQIEDVMGYHRETIALIEQAGKAARGLLKLVKDESGKPDYNDKERAVLKELAAAMQGTSDLRSKDYEEALSAHRQFLAEIPLSPNRLGDFVSLANDEEHFKLIKKTSELLAGSLDDAVAAESRVSAFREERPGKFYGDYDKLIKAIAEDPRSTWFVYFGGEQDEGFKRAMRLRDPWDVVARVSPGVKDRLLAEAKADPAVVFPEGEDEIAGILYEWQCRAKGNVCGSVAKIGRAVTSKETQRAIRFRLAKDSIGMRGIIGE